MDFSKLKSKAQGLVEKVSDATKEASQSIATKTSELKEKVSDFKIEDIVSNLKGYEQHFSENDLWNKIAKIGKSIGATVIYPVLLLLNLLKSSEINLKEKAMIIGTLGYFILPVDFIPDALVGVGFTDDLAALTAAITSLAACITHEMQEQSKQKCHNLLGDIDDRAIDAVAKIIDDAHSKIND